MVYSASEDRYEKLKYRRVADSGLILPEVSFGLWRNLGDQRPYDVSRKAILKAFDLGIFSFDNAANYGPSNGTAEKTFGQVFKEDLKAYRDELVITTKAGFHMNPSPNGAFSGKKALMNAIDNSLLKMNLDYVDIFYLHRWDPETNLDEIANTLNLMVQQGKALYVGVSNFTEEQVEAIGQKLNDLAVPFVGNQISLNMLHPTSEKMLETVDKYHGGVVAYGPLSEGLLTDHYLGGIPEDFPIHWSNKFYFEKGNDHLVGILNELNDVAKERGQELSQMALAWLLRDRRVSSVVIGTTNVDHLANNLKYQENADFSDEEVAKINEILTRL